MRTRVLLDPTNNNGGDNKDEHKEELARLRQQLAESEQRYNELSGKYTSLERKHAKTAADLDASQKEIGGFRASEKRTEALKRALESAEYKGKVEVDTEKAMRYLSRGEFNEATLDQEIREAIDTVGRAVPEPGSSLNSRGVGDDKNKPAADKSDPLGSILTGSR